MPKFKEPLEDGWTRVSGKKSAPREFITGLPPPSKDDTLEKLISDFESKMKVWQRSSSREEVHRMLGRECPDEGWSFNKAVCLASGSFSRDNWECSKRSMFQFVAFVDTVQHLQATSSNSIQMFAQDPVYTDLDRDFLSRLNVNVLEMSWNEGQNLNLAADHLGPQTLVFELFMDMGPDIMRELLYSKMGLYVGSSMQAWVFESNSDVERRRNGYKRRGFDEEVTVSQIGRDKTQNELVREFREHHRSQYFPRFEDDPLVFEGLMFHWKQPIDEDDMSTG